MTQQRFNCYLIAITLWLTASGCNSRATKIAGIESAETSSKKASAPATRKPLVESLPAVGLSQVVRIPAQVLDGESPEGAESLPSLLTFTAGAADELPQGPLCFDVFDDGGFVISDPLLQRLAYYDGQGAYQRQLEVGFAVDQIEILPQGDLKVRKAKTGSYYQIDETGQVRQITETEPNKIKAKLEGQNKGVITFPGQQGAVPLRLPVTFEEPATTLISLRGLGIDHRRNAYVMLETSAPGDTIDVNTSVRVYNPSGKAMGALANLQFDYFVTPSEDFRVRGGKVYQLVPKRGEVTISVWDAGTIR